jgi:hypothetical protein
MKRLNEASSEADPLFVRTAGLPFPTVSVSQSVSQEVESFSQASCDTHSRKIEHEVRLIREYRTRLISQKGEQLDNRCPAIARREDLMLTDKKLERTSASSWRTVPAMSAAMTTTASSKSCFRAQKCHKRY